MKHLSHRWVTEMRCACCGVQAGTVLGAGVCERFAPDPKPAPLPHECETISRGADLYECAHCGHLMSSYKESDPCPARNNPPGTYPSTLRASHGYVTDEESSPPAEKAETLPELPDKLRRYWNTHDARSLGGPHHDCLLLAECRKIVREELSKAQVETKSVWDGDYLASTVHRIVPGKEGE